MGNSGTVAEEKKSEGIHKKGDLTTLAYPSSDWSKFSGL